MLQLTATSRRHPARGVAIVEVAAAVTATYTVRTSVLLVQPFYQQVYVYSSYDTLYEVDSSSCDVVILVYWTITAGTHVVPVPGTR